MSVFLRDGSRVFHTYSTYARGADILVGTCRTYSRATLPRGGLLVSSRW